MNVRTIARIGDSMIMDHCEETVAKPLGALTSNLAFSDRQGELRLPVLAIVRELRGPGYVR